MIRKPGATPIEFSTKFIEDHLKELQQSMVDDGDDENIFDDVAPRLNVNPKKTIAKDLPKIEVKAPAPPPQIKRKPYKFTKRPSGPQIVDIEYTFEYQPARIEPPPVDTPEDYGDAYMRQQLLDLAFQFTRLSVPN